MDLSLVNWAKAEAERYLSRSGNHWRHVLGVVESAWQISILFPEYEGGLLIASAYLHDIAYAPQLVETGFHPIDGARFVRSVGCERLARLIAHHSGARFEAQLRGLSAEISDFPRKRSAVADALDYCDLVTSPTGERITIQQRKLDIYNRYGPHHLVSESFRMALPSLTLEVARTTRRLKGANIDYIKSLR